MSSDPSASIRTTPWNAPDPAQVPDLRAALAAQMRTPFEISRTAKVIAAGRGSFIPPSRNPEGAARTLCEQEYERLTGADLYAVTAEMTRLAVVAGESLPDFRLEPEDLPAPTGFMVFAQPIGSYLNTDGPAPERFPIVAVSWGQYSRPGFPRGGVWITFYTPVDLDGLERQAAELAGRPLRERERTRIRSLSGPLNWDNEAIIGYGSERKASYEPGASHDAKLDEFAPWSQTLRAAWLLMSQPQIADVEELEPSRAVRRRAQKAGLDIHAVRVLHLRRLERDHEAAQDDSASREYTCRWMVRGHWRQQWYPSRGVHRPIWINPHIKGPDGKPLRTGETVHLWDR
ncbi:hypothetical protein KZ829_00400 [Actinoplanes hulinensis]|uniref:Uncharacterized protein n=1 Tax=Actinoplanes hulinensis TaxID=1144547 RepID=A0ABS7ATS1_9ACTN|nr:hypothetical protein [Actinoplanes hulinensis]MBW6432206.1 hypothetical protein [Actinoplanes hulinensis]